MEPFVGYAYPPSDGIPGDWGAFGFQTPGDWADSLVPESIPEEDGFAVTKKVFVVGGDASVRLMFHKAGWVNVFEPGQADFICFTGGADISPELYGQVNKGFSYTNPERDKIEVALFEQFRDKKFVGICRGGQLLNVLSGGSMIQDLDDPHGGHRAIAFAGGAYKKTFEDHHQGMLPGVGATIVAMDTADNNAEILWYKHTRALCFQAHPEWGCQDTEHLFFTLIEEYFT